MKRNIRLTLNTIQTLTHYGFVFFPLFVACLPLWSFIRDYLKYGYTGGRAEDDLTNISLPFLLIAVLLAFIQYMRLRYKEVYLTFTEEQFQEAIERTKKDLEWRVKKNNKTFFRAHRAGNWSASRGEMITIIKDNDRLLVNSICDPDGRMSVSAYGWNRKNIQVFLKNLTDVLNNKPAEIKVEKTENEWGLKRIAIRLIAYPFCIFLIVFGGYTVLQSESIRSVFYGLCGATIACVYLYSDIKILTQKNDNNSTSH